MALLPLSEVFIDASFWIALHHGRDVHHEQAGRTWSHILTQNVTSATTNWTLYEAASFLNGRFRHDTSLELLDLAGRATQIVDAVEYERRALNVFTSHADKRWSVVDCASFVCIRERGTQLALSFDRDFVQAQNEFGFTVMGMGAFT